MNIFISTDNPLYQRNSYFNIRR